MTAIPIKFQTFLNKLNTKNVRLIKSDIVYGVYDNSAIKGFNNIPKGIQNFYSEIELLNCKWELVDYDNQINYLDKEIDIVCGEINIPKIDFFEQKPILDFLDPYKIFDSSLQEDLSQYVPFDYITSELAICYKKNKRNNKQDRLYLCDFSEKGLIREIDITVLDYLEEGYKSYFFSKWQESSFFYDKTRKKLIDFYCSQLFKE